MNRKSVLSLSSLLLFAAAAQAGTVYIPLPGYQAVGPASWEPSILVSNGSDQSANFKQLFLRTDTDGTLRPPSPTSQALAGSQSTGLAPEPGSTGLLELSGPDTFSFSGRLQRVQNEDGTELPVISSENAAPAGETLYVQGLRRGPTVATDWTIVNLGWTAASCKISAFSVNGAPIGSAATLVLKPLSSRIFPDVLQTLGITAGDYVRGSVSCDQPFYTFGMSRDSASGDVGLIEPSGRGNSGLVLPGQGGGGGGGNQECPTGAACFEVKGLAFKPSKSMPVKRFSFPVPPGNYERIHFEMDVKNGGWYASNKDGKHMLFWLVKNRNYYMYGYANFEGPGKNDVIFRHGVAITHPEKIKITAPIAAQEGHTYHLEYTYDTRQNFLKLIVSENGTVLATINGTPNTNVIDFASGDVGIIDIGFDGSNPNEMPTYGWQYSNLKIQWLK